MVTSREGGRERSVRAWYVMKPPHTIYLFATSYALRAGRWRRDPWVRLTIPSGGPSVEGLVSEVAPDELDEQLISLVLDRWWMWGATTPEGLKRMLRDKSHLLYRVDAGAGSVSA